MKSYPYISFQGNCEDAINFYAQLFNAEVSDKKTYNDAEIDLPESYRNKISHVELTGNGISIMAYDVAPDTPLNSGNKVVMSLDLQDKSKAQTLFDALSKDGTVHEALTESDWNALYGRCTDRFNVQWMINCDLN